MQEEPKLEFYSEDEKVVEKVQKGLTSVEAAALLLSGGKTTDAKEAEMHAAAAAMPDLDDLVKSGLRRRMGFDFQIKTTHRKIHVYSKEGPHVSTHCKVKAGEMDEYGNIISEDLINRMVDACLRLKEKWTEAIAKKEVANAR